MRIFLQIVLPLLAPVAIYAVWAHFTRSPARGGKLPGWEEGHWFWAVIAGFILAAISIGFMVVAGSEPGTTYVPPYVEDGRIVPGEFK